MANLCVICNNCFERRAKTSGYDKYCTTNKLRRQNVTVLEAYRDLYQLQVYKLIFRSSSKSPNFMLMLFIYYSG